jgi:hypothetical protein
MNWDALKTAIGTIAPWLAGTLGSPFAGVAVQKLCDVFGLTAQASPEQLAQAVSAATPEQLQTLKAEDNRHAEFMAQIGYNSLELLNSDRASARRREISVKDKTPSVLAGLAVAGFVALVVYTAAGNAPDARMHDTFMMLTGAAVALAKDVYGYYFGSSSSSRAKDDTIKGLTQ